MNKSNIFLILVVNLLQLQCSDPFSVPADIPIGELLVAPETLSVGNQNIFLSTSIYLNLQPSVSKTPMIIPTYIETSDSSDFPLNVTVDAIYIVNRNQIWKSYFTNETPPETELRPYRIFKIARDGPYWGPEIYVDAIVTCKIDKKIFLLRASNQLIGAAY